MMRFHRVSGSLALAVLAIAARVPHCAAQSGFSENFDSVTPPALPTGWVTTHSPGAGALWITAASGTDTPPNVVQLGEPTAPYEDILDSAPFYIATSSAQLRFQHDYAFFVDLGG